MDPRVRLAALVCFATALPAFGQQVETQTARISVSQADGAVLRGLDKRTGDVTDFELATGETAALGRLQITLGECRYPVSNPSGNAFAYLVIREAGVDQPTFGGWMVAAAPALNPLEHSRYDIWVMRCNT